MSRRLDVLSGAQPSPVNRAGGASMHEVAVALHRRRMRHGLDVYGTLLQAFNGRQADVDFLQEQQDGLVYAIQRALESAAIWGALDAFRERLSLDHTRRGDASQQVLDEFDALFTVEALAARAEQIAAALIEEAVAEDLPDVDLGEEASRVAGA